jgi:hypothetical protein
MHAIFILFSTTYSNREQRPALLPASGTKSIDHSVRVRDKDLSCMYVCMYVCIAIEVRTWMWSISLWNACTRTHAQTSGLPEFYRYNIPKRENGQKIYHMVPKYTKGLQNRPNGHKVYQHLHWKTLLILPKLGFLVLKYTIWQVCQTWQNAFR